jgi:hypothetical protein
MLKLMNSAMMPVPGTYVARKITVDEARAIVQKFHGKFESYIGYPDTAKYMSEVLGVDVPVNRSETSLADRDEILVCKLRYRVKDPGAKGTFTPNADDYEWWHVIYRAE